jgi:prepilin-type N-terminal cleavage/methylation domain-containing protein
MKSFTSKLLVGQTFLSVWWGRHSCLPWAFLPKSRAEMRLRRMTDKNVCPTGRMTQKRAFTLPEVLAAMVLIGITLPSIMKGVSLSLAASDNARRKVEAAGLAESKLAELTADAKSQLSSAGGSGDFGADYPGYQWEATTVDIDTDVQEIDVRVFWNAHGAERDVTISSMAYTGAGGTSTSATSTGTGGGS